jgi:hypothetical protein
MGIVLEFWYFLVRHRKFYLFLVIAVLFLVGGLVVLTEGTAVAPFVYTLF